MMGSGKSAVGALLAERIGWAFYDTDLLLEAAFGRPVGEVFEGVGEPSFRAAEDLLVRLLVRLESAVLATGGGLWTHPPARRRLQAFAYTAYLEAPAQVLWSRIESEGVRLRPALAGPDARAALERLLAVRTPAYELADWRVDAGSEPESIVRQLVGKLRAVGLVARAGAAV